MKSYTDKCDNRADKQLITALISDPQYVNISTMGTADIFIVWYKIVKYDVWLVRYTTSIRAWLSDKILPCIIFWHLFCYELLLPYHEYDSNLSASCLMTRQNRITFFFLSSNTTIDIFEVCFVHCYTGVSHKKRHNTILSVICIELLIPANLGLSYSRLESTENFNYGNTTKSRQNQPNVIVCLTPTKNRGNISIKCRCICQCWFSSDFDLFFWS